MLEPPSLPPRSVSKVAPSPTPSHPLSPSLPPTHTPTHSYSGVRMRAHARTCRSRTRAKTCSGQALTSSPPSRRRCQHKPWLRRRRGARLQWPSRGPRPTPARQGQWCRDSKPRPSGGCKQGLGRCRCARAHLRFGSTACCWVLGKQTLRSHTGMQACAASTRTRRVAVCARMVSLSTCCSQT